MPDFTRGFV